MNKKKNKKPSRAIRAPKASKREEALDGASDAALLFHTALIVSSADGSLDRAERTTVDAYFATLPEFRGRDLRKIAREALRLSSGYESLQDSLRALRVLSKTERLKAYLFAVDVAMASHGIDAAEAIVLTQLVDVLELPMKRVKQIHDVMMLKYAPSGFVA